MDGTILLFIIIGFVVQMIDGALGMGYGVCSNSILLSMGIPPALSSASVHFSEMFTTFVSGIAHWKFKNVDTHIWKRLIIPGVIGGILGAYVLTNFPGKAIKPIVSAILLVMGLVIIYRGLNRQTMFKKLKKHISSMGLVGGFFDAVGGGGWGPVCTTTLVARGNDPRYAVGSVNASEWFVTVAESITFIICLSGGLLWHVIIGLILGGLIAAPFAALLTKKLNASILAVLVGVLVIACSLKNLWGFIF